jgi:hypothetical protein
MHYALLDFDGRRRMERVALEGDEPVGVNAESESQAVVPR